MTLVHEVLDSEGNIVMCSKRINNLGSEQKMMFNKKVHKALHILW